MFSAQKPKEVKVYYTSYDANGNQADRGMEVMQLREHKPETSKWVYHVKIPFATQGGKIVYRIEADGEVIRDEPPRIEILEPPLSASIEASQTIPIRVRVMSSAPISEVSVVYDSPTALAESSPSRVLARELSSNTYIGEVPVQRNQTDGDTWFYVTATNEKGIKVRSVTRAVHAKTTQPPPVPKIVVLKPPGRRRGTNQ